MSHTTVKQQEQIWTTVAFIRQGPGATVYNNDYVLCDVRVVSNVPFMVNLNQSSYLLMLIRRVLRYANKRDLITTRSIKLTHWGLDLVCVSGQWYYFQWTLYKIYNCHFYIEMRLWRWAMVIRTLFNGHELSLIWDEQKRSLHPNTRKPVLLLFIEGAPPRIMVGTTDSDK